MRQQTPDAVHVGVYGEVNANLIDGSSIWLQSVCLTLATIPGARVTVLLRAPVERDLVIRPLLDHPQIDVVESTRWQPTAMMTPLGAVTALRELDDEDSFDFVLLRGAATGAAAAMHGRFDGRIWLYHVPVDGTDPEQIARDGLCAHRILCQTEEIRERVASAAPQLASRTLILPPMIPPADPGPSRPAGPIRRLFYAGKISPEYYALEMVELLSRLRAEIPRVELHIAGDKIHNPPADPDFRLRVEQALSETEGLIWHGGVGRDKVAELLGSADLALSLRHPNLDASAEMSTKVLEYGGAGRAVLLNRNAVHVRLLGEDYPLMASDLAEAVERLVAASRDPALLAEAARRVQNLSTAHSFERVAVQIAPHLGDGAVPVGSRDEVAGGVADLGPRLLAAGHSFGFTDRILSHARERGADVREDHWKDHFLGNEECSAEMLEWAEVVFCEWCLGNAVWYSRHKRPGQWLVVRFHRMELETAYPADLDLAAVDAMVFVAQHVLDAACERFGWRTDDPRFSVVPNGVGVARLAQPKLPGAEFNLGMIGYVPWVKRLDRSLEIVERVRAQDDRYRLVIKGRGPWEYSWMLVRDAERRAYEESFRRIERSPLLGQAVVFEPFGDDIPAFLQQIGWILSTSEIEGHSVALAEGMASGAIPVIIDRPGAQQQYEARWVHSDVEAAVQAILATREKGEVLTESDAAGQFAQRWSWEEIGPAWDRLLRLSPESSPGALTSASGDRLIST